MQGCGIWPSLFPHSSDTASNKPGVGPEAELLHSPSPVPPASHAGAQPAHLRQGGCGAPARPGGVEAAGAWALQPGPTASSHHRRWAPPTASPVGSPRGVSKGAGGWKTQEKWARRMPAPAPGTSIREGQRDGQSRTRWRESRRGGWEALAEETQGEGGRRNSKSKGGEERAQRHENGREMSTPVPKPGRGESRPRPQGGAQNHLTMTVVRRGYVLPVRQVS